MAGNSQPEGEGVDRPPPDSGRGLVCRSSGSDGSGGRPTEAHRQGGRGSPRQRWLTPQEEAGMLPIENPIGASSVASAPTLELHEIQATVLRPRPAPYFGTHVLFRIDDAQAGRAFLRRLTPYVDSAADSRIAANAW